MSSIAGLGSMAESLGGSVMSELGGNFEQQLLEAGAAKMMLQEFMPMLMNMASETQKVMNGDSSGLL